MTRDKFKKSILTYINDGTEYRLFVCDYVNAKTKDLREFGYTNLTVKEVLNACYDILIDNKKDKTVIHGFIKDEIKL